MTATNDVYTTGVFVRALFESVLRKDISWIEQDEYRLVCAKGEHPNDLVDFYPVTGIYMGNKMGEHNQAQVKRICKGLKVP